MSECTMHRLRQWEIREKLKYVEQLRKEVELMRGSPKTYVLAAGVLVELQKIASHQRKMKEQEQ